MSGSGGGGEFYSATTVVDKEAKFKKPLYPSDSGTSGSNNHCMADEQRSVANWDKPFSKKLTF